MMENTDDSIRFLTLQEAAAILKISTRTLYRVMQSGRFPAFKVGGQWRILESRFLEWVAVGGISNSTPS
jgi:excisionase family DNA binding protein